MKDQLKPAQDVYKSLQVQATASTSSQKSSLMNIFKRQHEKKLSDIIAIPDENGHNHYYQKQMIEKKHPKFGKIHQEEWKDLGESPRGSVCEPPVAMANPITLAQKNVSTTTVTSINLFSMSNVTMSLSMSDLFGWVP